MYGYVAKRASLVFLRLIVERRDSRSHGVHGKCVALEAEQVHLAALQQAWIGGSVRRMASHTTFSLHRSVLKGEGARFVRVAIEADHVLRGSGA